MKCDIVKVFHNLQLLNNTYIRKITMYINSYTSAYMCVSV